MGTEEKSIISLKSGAWIKTLSIISLVCVSLSFIAIICYCYVSSDSRRTIAEFILPYIVFSAAVLVFSLYVFRYYSQLRAKVTVPVVFGLVGLWFGIQACFSGRYIRSYDELLYCILELVIFVCSVLMVISSLKGLKRKALLIITVSICLIYSLLVCGNVLSNVSYTVSYTDYLGYTEYYDPPFSYYLSIIVSFLGWIGQTSFFVALLLFGLKNKIPRVISSYQDKVKEMDPEKALKLLKDKLDLEIITEEEYQAQRAEIISKL